MYSGANIVLAFQTHCDNTFFIMLPEGVEKLFCTFCIDSFHGNGTRSFLIFNNNGDAISTSKAFVPFFESTQHVDIHIPAILNCFVSTDAPTFVCQSGL